MTTPFESFKNGARWEVSGQSLYTLAQNHQTPLYVYSEDALLQNLERFQTGLRSIDALICFAVKSCSNIAILRLLGKAGAGADLVSGGELFRALQAGISPDRIVFSGVGKTPAEIREALAASSHGILSFHVESLSELQLIQEIAKSVGKRASVSFRFNPDVNPKTHPYIATGLKKNKFGLSRTDILEAIRLAQNFSHVDIRGLSIHIGSQLTQLGPLDESFRKLRALSAEVARLRGAPLDWLDLGGGVAIRYDALPRSKKTATIEQYCALVQKHFGPQTQAKAGSTQRILLEPGRIISGNSAVLLSRVLYEKPLRGTRSKKSLWIIDAGMNDLARPSLYESWHDVALIPASNASKRSATIAVDLAGPVCESSDYIARDRRLPASGAQGGLLAIGSAGAYGFSMASQYNSRPRPAEVLIRRDGRIDVIRDRETYLDLIRGEK